MDKLISVFLALTCRYSTFRDSLVRQVKEKSVLPSRSGVNSAFETASRLTSMNTVQHKIFGEVIEHRGVKLYWNRAKAGVEVKLRFILGRYETTEADLINKYLGRTMDVIELGGGIGFTSCFINERVDTSTTHIVVEANKYLLPVLEANADLNECEFEIMNAAYASESDSVRFSPGASFWSGSLYRHGDKSVVVETTSLENLIGEFDLSTFALIVDIEGAEIDLLASELDVLESHCELLIIEFHAEKREYRHIADSIQSARTMLEESNFSLVESRGNVAVYRA